TEHQGVRRAQLAVRSEGRLYLRWDGEMHAVSLFDPIAAVEANQSHQGGLTAPMNGSIVRVLVEVGQTVEAGTQLVVLEAMKMEHTLKAGMDGTVRRVQVSAGDQVKSRQVLVEVEAAD
ncbi:acetyl-CoA carboxylase biotin carboxyl carrier protein subunit, partial [Acinetobacter guerrae]|uniref:acetyl-CoA carboxylase biotin carboxyl carrier protein subunit n=1 Tax=Acinetobacter guerrae TaxID=1843371 RepID=UPI0027E52ED4